MKFHDELNQKLFNGEELKPEVKDKLNEIADAFIEYLDIPADAIEDVVITGSCASYNYTEFSDIDLHLLVDFEKVHTDCPVVEGYLLSRKSEFNKNHDIFIYGIPVEVYAESINNENVHNGLYSLRQEKWIDIPKKLEPTDNDSAVQAKYLEYKQEAELCDDSEVATELINKIREMRKSGLAEGGEFSTENLTFKKLRDNGIIGKLMEIKKKGIDKQLSLESYNEDSSWSLERLRQLKNNIAKFNKEQSFYDPNAPKNGSEWSTRDLPNKYKERFNEICRKSCKYHLDILDSKYKLKQQTDNDNKLYKTYIDTDVDLGTSIENIIYVGTGIVTNNSSYIDKIKWDYGKELGLNLIQKIGHLPSREVKIYENINLLILTEEQHFSTSYRGKIIIFDKHELDNLEKDIDKQLSLESYNESLFKKELTPLPKKKPSLKIGDEVKINGVNGKIIKLKDMKMSNTPVYQIKLENGKTVWRYEEELNESVKDVKGGWFDKIVTFENDNYKMKCYIKGIKVASCYIIRKKDNNTIMQLIDPKYDKPIGLDEKCRAWNTLREYMQRMADRKNIQINFEEIEGMKEEFIIRKQSEFDGATEEEVGQADSELNAEEAGKKELKQMIADKKIAHPLIKIYKRDAETGNDTFVKDIKPIDLEENQVEESVDHLSDKIDYVNSQLKELIQSITRPEPVLAESYESLSAKIKQALGE